MACKKLKQNQRGFTLVEVIVVAVIVAAMAAVAVPMYIAYVDNSRSNAAANAAGSVASFLGSCRNSGGVLDQLADAGDELAGPAVVTCDLPGEGANNPTVGIPAGITIRRAEAGTAVTAQHADGGEESQPYSY